ncbi:MAG: hypothetical protein HC877_24435 [Thioploca sp.]|nr:hypothetical protein [Thioploca sp.]
MNLYINPPDMSKEEWLMKNAIDASPLFEAGIKRCWATVPEGTLPVCIIDSGTFIDAGIVYDEEKYDAFNLDDGRAKLFILVPIDKLLEVQPELKNYLKS